jgi:Zn-dependent peptidase ImmA (M78 family)/DNA-binding XRE family transcriptional regulator
MTSLFEPFRLTIARQYNGLRKSDLARELGFSPSAITQLENGATKPSHSTLAKLSLRLGFPVEFFLRDGRRRNDYALGQSFFRSLRSTPQIERERAEARAFLVCELVEALEAFVRLPEADLPNLSALESAHSIDIEDAAIELRERWAVPSGPVASVVRLLESRGVVVTRSESPTRHVDAFSRWFGKRPVVVLAGLRLSLDRLRFDAAHELGHLVLHSDVEPGNRQQEDEAQRFAAAFLMPAADICDELPTQFNLRVFGELKQTWGVSIAALVFRARALGRFSPSTYKRAMMSLSKQGRMVEPFYLSGEEDIVVFQRALSILRMQKRDLEDIASLSRLPLDFVRATLSMRFDDRPALQLSSSDPVFESVDGLGLAPVVSY